jgi:acetolactate synthase-1/2/3 large subunit
MTTCGEVLAKMMGAYGIDTAFGIPGVHTIELYRGLPKTNIRHVTPRHEQGAGFMADGYARVTGKPAACITVSGPGAFNITTAVSQAYQDSVPMLIISADNATHTLGLREGRLHETNSLQRAMEQCCVWAHTLMRPDELPKVLARAFTIFNSERPGPVHLILPLDVITADASHVSTDIWDIPSRPAPHPSSILEAAAILSAAKKPVIALGGGAADAADMMVALAERLDAPTTVTQNAKGILPADHPLYVASSPSYEPVRQLYRDADVILGIGTEFAETDYDFLFDGKFGLGDAKLIRIDISAEQLTRNTKPTLAICSDSRLAADALLPLLPQKQCEGKAKTIAVNTAMKNIDHPAYQAFLDAIQDALPDAIFIGDSTQPVYFAAGQYHSKSPRTYACSSTGYGTLGYALPASFGAKLGKPDTPVVCMVGDGGLQFTINELSTAVEANIPVAVVIWNNECYEMIAQGFRQAGMEPQACDIYTPNFLKIAEGYGCPSVDVKNIDEFKAALKSSTTQTVPTIIHVREENFIDC